MRRMGLLVCFALFGCQPKSVEDSWQPPKIFIKSSESQPELGTKRLHLSDQDNILFLDTTGQHMPVDRLQVKADCGELGSMNSQIHNPAPALTVKDILPDRIYFNAKSPGEVSCDLEFTLINSLGSTNRTQLQKREISLSRSAGRALQFTVNGLPVSADATYLEDDIKRARIENTKSSGELRLLCQEFQTQASGSFADIPLPDLLRASIEGASEYNDPRNRESQHRCQLIARTQNGEKFSSEIFQLVFGGPPLKAKLSYVKREPQATFLHYVLSLKNQNEFPVSVSIAQPTLACEQAHLQLTIEDPKRQSVIFDSKLIRDETIDGKPYILITVPGQTSETVDIKLIHDQIKWLAPECAAAGAWHPDYLACKNANDTSLFNLSTWRPELRFAKASLDIRSGAKFEHHPFARVPYSDDGSKFSCAQNH